MAVKFLSGINVEGSLNLVAADIPNLAASKITSGTLSTSRIPSLAASKITSGTFADARIASAGNWNTAHGWGNHASANYLTSVPSEYLTATEGNAAYDAAGAASEVQTWVGEQGYTGDQDLSGYLTSVPSTFTTAYITATGYIKGNGQQLVLSAGEAHNYATGQTSEYIYMNAEQGIQVNSETGNWNSGWAARKTAYLRGDQLTLDGEALTKSNIQNFKTAYGWGDHGAGGYATETWVGEQGYTGDQVLPTLASLGALSTTGKAADSNLLDGLDLHTGRNNAANKVVRSNGSGYVDFGWINTTSGNTTSTLTDIYVNTNDGYIRKATPAHFRSQITDAAYDAAGSAAAALTDAQTWVGEQNYLTSETDSQTLSISGTTLSLTNGGSVTLPDNNTWRGIHDSPVNGATTTSISSNWAFDNVKTVVPANAVFTDTVNTFDGAYGSLSGTPTIPSGNAIIDWTADQGSTNIHSGNYTNTDTVYTHPTSAGNKHIPTGGSAGQFLKYSASGTASWATPSYTTNTDNQLSDAYVIGLFSAGTNVAISDEGVISSTDTNTDTVYTHPTTAGNKHIPTGGAAGQFLKYSSSGTAVWSTPSYTTNTNTQLSSADVIGMFTAGTNVAIAEDGTISSTDTNTVYSHPTTAGNKHVPTGGSAGQFLKYSSSGTATWATPSYTTNTNTQLTQTEVVGMLTAGTNVTISDEGLISSTDTDTVYSHPTTAGNKHIPTGGSAGQFLKYSASGTASWATPSYTTNTDTNTTYTAGTGILLTGTVFSCTVDTPAEVGLGNLSSSGNALSGTFTATGDLVAYSDARVKENVETIPNALEKVTALRGVNFDKIGEEKRSTGVIAQEIAEVLPEVVHETEDGMLAVAYGNITGVLIEAIKEQQKQIDELKARLDGFTK